MSYSDEWPRPPRQKPRTLWSDLAGLWGWLRSRSIGMQLLAAAVVLVILVVIVSAALGPEPDATIATRSTTSRPTVASTTTSTVVIPAGDDTLVRSILDGDSFELPDGTKIRLIGIDAPDVETSACFSAEATAHLRELLPAGGTVRLVYDTSRTDRLGRTLAYVYRLPDGLFLNVAMARDGFATELTTPPNTRHSQEIAAAVAEARTAGRGMWQTCSTTTTAARPATTSGTAAPGTTAPATTSTTETTEAPATTTTTTPSSSSSTTATTRITLVPG